MSECAHRQAVQVSYPPASWGNSAEAQAYRQLELQMILDSGGDLGPAFEMGVEDLRNSGFYVSPEAEEAARSVVELWQ